MESARQGQRDDLDTIHRDSKCEVTCEEKGRSPAKIIHVKEDMVIIIK